MDRSAFSFKGSTNDLEKRIEFKAKLANKIEPSQPKELPLVDNTFNGVSPGGLLVHPSLGEGTLVSVDHGKNEVIIDFRDKGLIELVLSQAKSFVHSPVKVLEKGISGVDDPFLGGEIQSRLLAPQDRDFREVDLSKITSPDFETTEKLFYPVGSRVWHPNLGVCTVSSIDEKKNNVVLTTNKNNRIELVLSQVRSKLRAVEDVVDHIPVKPLVRESLGQRFPTYKARGDVEAWLPEVFKTWNRNQQFMYLTRSEPLLTTEQANDVFAVLEGKTPMFYNVKVSWQTQEETEANVFPAFPGTPEPIEKIEKFSQWGNHRFWHPDFGECSVSSADYEGNLLILQTSVGQVPFVLDATISKLAIMKSTDNAVDHAKRQLGAKTPVVKENTSQGRKQVDVSIPETFKTWKPIEQYQYLTVSCLLPSDQANDVLDIVSGRSVKSKTDYKIQFTVVPPEPNKRTEYKQQLLDRIEKTVESVEPLEILEPIKVEPVAERTVGEVVVVKKTPIVQKLSVNLPSDFNMWTDSGKYVFLTRTKQLTSNEANDILDILHGRQPYNKKIAYEITWSE